MTKELRFRAAKMPAKVQTKIKIKGKTKIILDELYRQFLIHPNHIDQNDDWSQLNAIKIAAEILGHKGIVRQLDALFEVMSLGEGVVLDD